MQSSTAIANVFRERSNGMPGVIGAIDGCHIPIKQPEANPIDFYNRKGYNSIILQAVCDHEMKFTNITVGMPGRMHDSRVFRNSPLYRQMMNAAHPLISPENHLIGDSAYPLLGSLLTPFRNNGHLNAATVNYSTKLSKIRCIIERAFGLLKGKFRRLKYLDMSDELLINKTVAVCCILHNFILNNERLNVEEFLEEEAAEEVPAEMMPNEREGNERGQHKRNYIVDLLVRV
ncbi:putative nuclease HARBI1 [Ischnura elegans]|uniref:putative nuclease HARBI1 n=1 Tax=Ischnura elegans TaxID=197161 RepID=UPI001ED8B0F8|nr:putative nuclease HARBI1 [Ischnura elegans]